MSAAIDEVVRRLGGTIYDGGRRALVPGPGHSSQDRSLSLVENAEGRIVYFSHAGDPDAAIRAYLGLADLDAEDGLSAKARAKAKRERLEAQAAEKRRKLMFCRKVWDEAEGVNRRPVGLYLVKGRGIPLRSIPPSIRFHPAAPRSYAGDKTDPAMVAMVQDTEGQACGLHLTFLRPDFLSHAGRIMVGSARGGAVRLHEAGDDLAVCEGIETGLSYSFLHGVPTWALLSTSQFVTFKPPVQVDRLFVAADSDDKTGASVALAHAMVERISTAKVEVHAAPTGKDWNTALREGGAS